MDTSKYDADAKSIGLALSEKIKDLVAEEVRKLSEVWADLWSEEERQKRKKLLQESFLELNSNWLEEILSKEIQMKEELIARIEELLEEINNLEQELNIKIPYEEVESLPLQCMAKELNQKAQKYRDVKEARMTRLRELRETETALMEIMGVLPFEISLSAVPTEAQLESLHSHLLTLDDEKHTRMGIFMEKRQRIMELFEQLGTKPNLHFEKDVVMEPRLSPFKVTDENMAQLGKTLDRLENEARSAEERRAELVQMLLSLWEYLEQSTEEFQAFLEQHPGISQTDLNALQADLDRCKKEKSQNIGKFVLRIRDEIKKQWDKCFVGDAIRSEFRVMRVVVFNEDVYDLHEIELQRWQNYHSDNQRIFDLYEKHTALFDNLVELNGLGKSAKRYHNRGGQLLQEEKQRKIVAKDLPRIENELRGELAEFQKKHSEPFRYFGQPLLDVINEKWRTNFDQKVIDRFRDGAAATRTPLAVKRPAVTTSASTGGKMSRLAAPTPTNTAPQVRRKLLANKPEKQEPDSTMNLETSYDGFQRELKSKLGVSKLVSRSTEVLTPRKVLRERTQPVISVMSTRSSPVLAATKISCLPTPKTVPRRGRPAGQSKTPSRNRLPCIL